MRIKRKLHLFYLAFRYGHGTIGMLLSMVNFIILIHTFVIDKMTVNLHLYQTLILFLITYPLICIIMGRIQLKKQLPADQQNAFENNPTVIRIELLKLKMFKGIATDKEVNDMIRYYEGLLK